MKLRHVAILSSVFFCLSTAPAFARTLVVDNDGAECPQAEYNTIQQAVAAAEAGDKILVCPGLYFGTVLVDEPNLRIEAQAAPGEVVLQGTGAVGELGFHLLDTTSVVLQGFTVQGFGRAQIRIEGGRGNTVRKNVTKDAVVNDGIQVIRSSANIVEHNTSHGNREDGIFLGQIPGILGELVFDNIIRHNETFDNRQHGINQFRTGPGNVIFGNRSHSNRIRGINVFFSNGTVIEENYAFANGLVAVPGVLGVGVGIVVNNSTGVTVKSNRSEKNGSNGIGLTLASNNVVTNNRSETNRTNGIALNGAADNVVEKNEVFGNVQDGIRLINNSDRNTIQLNHVQRNQVDGIHVFDLASSENVIERNVIRGSGVFDAHDDSKGAGTSGTANFWIDNKCETDNPPGLCEHPDH